MTDTHAATELKLYIDSDASLHRQQHVPIIKNLATKRARGQYKHDLAVKAFGYLTEAGAKKYAKEFGSPSQPWHKMFDAGTRKLAAEELARDFEAEAALGNYDYLLPKKYQVKEKSADHARKKLAWKVPEGITVTWSPTNQAYFALWPGKGRAQDQQLLKVARAEDMHGWLRDTYGEPYGLASRASARIQHATMIRHTRKKNPAQLDREIAEVLGKRRHV